jgi:DNA-binding SARP family transcriptional activator/tetratricopeptide (TPR) repeat protein
MSALEVLLLGTLEVRVDGEPVALGPPKQRGLLALLALNANRVVPREQLVDGLWGDDPPPTVDTAVHVYVSHLRKLLPPGSVVTQSPGYLLSIAPEALDVQRFDRLLDEASAAAPKRAAELLREALELWRGPPLAEFAEEPFARVEAGRLDELRLRALEERLDADLALGRDAELIGELTALVAEHPHKERLRRQLMLALYRTGRQPEALAAYQDIRAALAELGLEPGVELRTLERAMLTQDPALDVARREIAGLPGPLVPEPAFPFVGREDELTRLRTLLDRAEHGQGSLAALAAEAGGGKTRLAREFAHAAAAGGALVLYGTSDASVRIPYAPLRQWLEYLLRVCDPSELRECLGEGGILARLVPEVAAVAGATIPPTGDVETDRYLLQHAAAEFLGRLARGRTLVAIADDVHWADDETLHLLRTLARTAPEACMLVVAAYRDVPSDLRPAVVDALADLWRLDGVARLSLGGLTTDDVVTFVRESASAEATPELVAALTELTDGTPLLLCELWRELLATGAVEVSDGVRLVGRIDDVRGPERIRDGIQQRLGRLGPDVAAIVELAAVTGPTFDVPVIVEAAGRERATVPAALDGALGGGLIEELPGPTPACRFTHELVRRAVYDRLKPLRRAELHLRVGEALERVHADDPERVVQELAIHFTQAAMTAGPERAIHYNMRAAEAAVNADAYAEAADRLSTALELGIEDGQTRAHVQTELEMVLRGLGRFDESGALLAAIPDEPLAASRARFIRVLNDPAVVPEELLEEAQSAIDTFTETEDLYGLAVAWRHFGLVRRRQGRLTESVAAFESAIRNADASGRRDAYRWAVGSLAYVLCDGPVPVLDAIRRIEELERSSAGDALSATILGQFKGGLYAMAGRLVEARELLERSDAEFGRYPTGGTNRPAYREPAAEAWELIGEPARAEVELEAKCEHYRGAYFATNAQALQAAYRLALLCCDNGRWDEAETWTGHGRDVPVPDRFAESAVLGLAARSRIAAHRGDLASAVEIGRRAVQLASDSDSINLRTRTLLALAEVHGKRGETSEADAALAAALRLYEAKGNITAAERVRTATALFVLGERDT